MSMSYETFAPFYKSNTVRALLVAGVAWLLSLIGIAEEASTAEAQRLVGLALDLAQGIGLAWAAYARTRQPTPALTLTKAKAEQKNAEKKAAVSALEPVIPSAAADSGAATWPGTTGSNDSPQTAVNERGKDDV